MACPMSWRDSAARRQCQTLWFLGVLCSFASITELMGRRSPGILPPVPYLDALCREHRRPSSFTHGDMYIGLWILATCRLLSCTCSGSRPWCDKPFWIVLSQVGNHGGIQHPSPVLLDTLPKSIQRGAVHLRGILGSDLHVVLGDGHILMP